MINRNQAADFFLLCADEQSGDLITHLKLQKLVYYAQAWHLALNNGSTLFEDDFEAWAHGPVCPPLYDRFSSLGFNAIPINAAMDDGSKLNGAKEHLEDVWNVYGKFSAKALERMTHSEEPWIEARGEAGPMDRSNAVISRKTMQLYYAKKLSNGEE